MKAARRRPRKIKNSPVNDGNTSEAEAIDLSRLGERQLRALIRLGRLAVQHREAAPLMEALAWQLVEALQVDVAEIWIVQPGGRELQRCHSLGWPEGVQEPQKSAVGTESQAGFTVACGTVVLVEDLQRETRFFGLHQLRAAGIVSSLSAPVASEGEQLGAICGYSRRARSFQESEIQFAQAAAAMMAVGAQWHRTQADLRENQRQLLAGIVRDMVERREVETALRRTEERYRALQLEHTELERIAVAGELAGIVAHEVRTPLNALSINVQMLERALRRGREDDLERARGLVGPLRDEIERINNLLRDYLQVLRRPPKGARKPFSLSRAVEDAVRFVEPKATSCAVRFEIQLSSAIQTLRGDEDRLRQVLLNVFLNAIQAMPDGGVVQVKTALDGDTVSLAIRDTGPGIRPEDRARIFQPFVTTKPHGTGLGLSISERLIRSMGGSIAVQSIEGEGSCFEIRLPVSGDDDVVEGGEQD